MYDGTFRLWRKDTSRKRVKWAHGTVQPCHSSPVRRIIFDPLCTAAEPRLYTASVDRNIKLTDITAGRIPFVAYTPSAVFDMDVQGGSGNIVSGHKDGGLRMWSVRDGKSPVAMGAKAHARAITSVSCLEDGFGVVTLGRDNVLKLSDIRVSLDDTVREMEGGVQTASDWHRAALRGRHVASGLDDSGGTVAIWNVDSGRVVRKLGPGGGAGEGDVFRILKGSPGCPLIPQWCPFGLVAASAEKQISYWS
jgi:WD40 repeat protein